MIVLHCFILLELFQDLSQLQETWLAEGKCLPIYCTVEAQQAHLV